MAFGVEQALGVNYDMKNLFFDRKVVQAEVGKKNAKALSKAGAFIQRTARNLIGRPVKAKTPPRAEGQPVRARSPDRIGGKRTAASLRTIIFAYDRRRQSVIVGPVKANGSTIVNGVRHSGTIPQLHEFGGTASVREKRVGKEWRPVGRTRPRPGQPTRIRRARYPERPFMGPALAKEAPNFPELFAG